MMEVKMQRPMLVGIQKRKMKNLALINKRAIIITKETPMNET